MTAGAAAAAPMGTVDLKLCNDCALIWNGAFEPERMVYAPGYENALHFSPKFQTFAEELAAGLVERHDLKGKHVFEIGNVGAYGRAIAGSFNGYGIYDEVILADEPMMTMYDEDAAGTREARG